MMHDVEVDDGFEFSGLTRQLLGICLYGLKTLRSQPGDAFIKVLRYDVAPDLSSVCRQDGARHIAIARAHFKEILILLLPERVVEKLYISRDNKRVADVSNQLLSPGRVLCM